MSLKRPKKGVIEKFLPNIKSRIEFVLGKGDLEKDITPGALKALQNFRSRIIIWYISILGPMVLFFVYELGKTVMLLHEFAQ